jgi:hypothetical protein
VLENRTNHFTIAVEDIFQMHNTSAVMRSWGFGIQELNVIEQRYGVIKLPWVPRNGSILMRLTAFLIV